MANFIDITNQKYNNLTAIKPIGKNKHRYMLWLCICDCGNEKIVSAAELRNSHVKTCGKCPRGPYKQFCINGHEIAIVGRRSSGICCECSRIGERKRSKTEKYKVVRRKWSKKYNQTEKRKKYKREWQRKIRQTEKYKAYFIPYKKQYDLEHPEQVKLSRLKAKTNRRLRIVPWGQEGMVEFYRNMPEGMTQEHYIPLQGKKVAGLHVIWNLSYLSQSENSKKGNRIDLLEASEWYGKLLEDAGIKEKR